MTRLFILIFLLVFPITSGAQYYVELIEKRTPDDLIQQISLQIKENNKAVLIFNTTLPLKYESSKEVLDPPIQLGNYQILIVTAGASAITILYDNTPTTLNFGQLMGETKPSLKENEIKYFDVSLQAELEILDITESELKRGNQILPIGPNVSDALITIKVFPSDLEFKIEEENNQITKVFKKENEYNVYLSTSTNVQKKTLRIIANNGEVRSIPIYELTAKDTRFFRISKPILGSLESTIENEVRRSENIESLNTLIGSWSGTLGSNVSHLKIHDPNPSINTIKAELFIEGIYYYYEGNYKQVNNNISISFNKKINNDFDFEDSKLEIEFSNNIISGALINDLGEASDLTMLKSSSIPPNDNKIIEKKLSELKKIIIFNWRTDDNIISEIQIKGIDYKNSIFGTFITKYGICQFKTKLNTTGENIFFNISIKNFCQALDYDIITNIGASSSATIIDNSTGNFRNVGLFKQSIYNSNPYISETNKVSSSSKEKIYVVNTERTYFYSEPDYSTIRKAYLISGQIPDTKYKQGEFYYVEFANLERTTTGFIKEKDLTEIYVKDFFDNTIWNANYNGIQLKLVFTGLEKNNNKEYEIRGHTEIGSTKKLFKGKISSVYPSGLNITLIESETYTDRAIFNLNLNYSGQASGSKRVYNNNSIQTFYFKKQ